MCSSDLVNAIVCSFHAGQEYSPRRRDWDQERYAKTAVEEWGADLVIMHHPHVLQGIGISNNRCIFYSLGNFVFGGNSAIRTEKFKVSETVTSLYSMVVQVRFTFSDEGTYLGQQATIYPVYTSSAAPVNNFQPMRVNAEDAIPVRDAIQRDTLFELPEILETDGLSRIELEYLPTTDEVMLPEGSDADNAAAAPEAASATPTRDNKGN